MSSGLVVTIRFLRRRALQIRTRSVSFLNVFPKKLGSSAQKVIRIDPRPAQNTNTVQILETGSWVLWPKYLCGHNLMQSLLVMKMHFN
jgi:hypothetical protein